MSIGRLLKVNALWLGQGAHWPPMKFLSCRPPRAGLPFSPAWAAPADGIWTPTGAMAVARTGHTETLLPDGTTFVAGGVSGNALASAERYNPGTGLWSAKMRVSLLRTSHETVRLQSKVAPAHRELTDRH